MPGQVHAERSSTTELAQACAEVERLLGAGQAASAEEVLAAHPALAGDDDAALEVVYTEFVAREALGQRPSPADFCARFPQWREGLAQLFEIHDTLAGNSTLAPAGDGDTWFSSDKRGWAAARPSLVAAGRRVGNYELLGELGRGGMGVVYRARQLGLGRVVALKMILAGDDAGPHERARFRAEAEAAARLAHPNIVQIHEVGEHEGRAFLSLEYVEGGSLEALLSGKPWPARESGHLVETLARAMQHAHEHGIVHRDLKPANVLLAGVGSRPDNFLPLAPRLLIPKIADFGLARRLWNQSAERPAALDLTAAGAILGSPAYMAPEQAAGDGRQVGPAADVYALGAILYELLTGRPPFSATSALETLERVRTREPLPPGKLLPGLPRDIETICLKCLHKEPGRRYLSAAALADDLGRFLRGEPIQARPIPAWEKAWKWARRRPVMAALLAALVAVTLVGLTSVTYLWRQTAAALVIVKTKQNETEAALASKVVALAERDWLANDLDAARRRLDECPLAYRGAEWRYLHRACNACQFVLAGQHLVLPVSALVWSPDGRYVAANGIYQPGMTVWDAESGLKRFTLTGHTHRVSYLAFDSQGRLVSLGWPPGPAESDPQLLGPAEVKIFEMSSGREAAGFPADLPLGRGPLSADGCCVLVQLAGKLALVDILHGPAVTALVARSGPIQAWTPSADGRLVAWSDDKAVHVWDTKAGALAASFPTGDAQRLVFSGDGERLAVLRWKIYERKQRVVEVWDHRTGQRIAELCGHSNHVSNAAFSPDGRRLATASPDQTVIVWDLEAGREQLTLRGHGVPVGPVAFSPDGTRLASGGTDGTVRIWDVRSFGNDD
jgi:serine/threonine protein kinase